MCAVLAAAAARGATVEAYAAGDIADCNQVPAAESVAATTARLIPRGAVVLVPGDAMYERPTLAHYRSCYQPTWGVHLADTLIVPGNHDYEDGRADGFLEYFGAAAGDHGHFARMVGDWLVIGLDSNLRGDELQQQLNWLAAALRDHGAARCTLAYWHTPLFSSGPHRGSGEPMRPFWAMLEAFGADLVLNGHEHNYEAFDPRDAAGRPTADGLREFVVGTGGARLYGFWRPPFSSRVRIERHGVLHLSLADGEYAWEFLDTDGHASDPGRARCRRK
jgi:acid phosphatase type 7